MIGEVLAARPRSFTAPVKAARSRLRTAVATDACCVSSLTDSAASAAFPCCLDGTRFVGTGLWLCLEGIAALLPSDGRPACKLGRDPDRSFDVLSSGAVGPQGAALAFRVRKSRPGTVINAGANKGVETAINAYLCLLVSSVRPQSGLQCHAYRTLGVVAAAPSVL